MVRFKNRWLLVDITFAPPEYGESLTPVGLPSSTSTLLRSIRASLQHNFGDVAAGALGGSLAVKYYSSTTRTAILRCSRIGVKEVWGAVTLCNEWDGRPIRMVVLHCGGTIRKVQEAAIKINRTRIQALQTKKKNSALESRPSILQQGNTVSPAEEDTDQDIQAILDKDRKIINAVQQ